MTDLQTIEKITTATTAGMAKRRCRLRSRSRKAPSSDLTILRSGGASNPTRMLPLSSIPRIRIVSPSLTRKPDPIGWSNTSITDSLIRRRLAVVD